MRLKPFPMSALLAIGICSPAFAQELPNAPTKGVTRIGFSLIASHDTNIAATSKGEAVKRGLAPDDYTLRPALDVEYARPFGRQIIFLEGSGGYDFHKLNTRLDRRNIRGQAGVAAPVGTCNVVATVGYESAQSDLIDVSGPVVENLQDIFSETFGVSCGRADGFSGMLVGQHQTVDNSSVIQQVSDYRSYSGTGALTYKTARKDELAVVGRYSDNKYPNSIVALGAAPGSAFRVASIGVSAVKNIGPKVVLNALVSRTLLDRDNAPASIASSSNFNTYRGGALYKVSPRLEFEAIGSRAIVPSSQTGKLYDLLTEAELMSRYRQSPRLQLALGAKRSDVVSNTDTSAGLQTAFIISKSRTDTAYGNITYRQSRLATFIFDARRIDRKTNVALFDYVDMRLSLTTRLAF